MTENFSQNNTLAKDLLPSQAYIVTHRDNGHLEEVSSVSLFIRFNSAYRLYNPTICLFHTTYAGIHFHNLSQVYSFACC